MDQSTLLIFLLFLYLIVGLAVSLVAMMQRLHQADQSKYRFSPIKAFLQHMTTLAATLVWPFFASSLALAFGQTANVQFTVMVVAALIALGIGYVSQQKPVVARSSFLGGLLTFLLSLLFYAPSVNKTTLTVTPIVAAVVVLGLLFVPVLGGRADEETK